MPIDIVKQGGRRPSEAFQAQKLHHSIVAVCLSVQTPEGEAENIARRVTAAVVEWCQQKPEATSSDIRRQAAKHLEKHHSEAAHLYKHHRQIL